VLPTNIIRVTVTERERWWRAKGLCCEVSFICCGIVYSVDCWVNTFSSANYIMLTSLEEYFRLQFSVAESCMAAWVLCGSLFTQFLSMTISWRHTSQGRVATCLGCGGIFNYHFIANVSLSLKPWFHVKIKLFERILVFYFNMKPRLKLFLKNFSR